MRQSHSLTEVTIISTFVVSGFAIEKSMFLELEYKNRIVQYDPEQSLIFRKNVC